MAIQAYGEITIVDISDVGKLSAYIASNQPTIVIYDPNSTNKYTPDWTSNNLTLTPVIFFNERQLGLTDTGVEIIWTRQAGSNEETGTVTGESNSEGVLKVSNNALSTVSSGLLTYLCTINYTDPDTKVTVSTKAQMSFSLVKNATELKDCKITGEQTFAYNGEGTLISASSIVLTATTTNTSVRQWQYKKSNGDFAVYPKSSATSTLTVNATDDVFTNDVAVVKCVTTDGTVFDMHQIVKIRDGAAGSNTITSVLSNESQSVPTNSAGTLFSSSLNGCESTITIYDGSDDDTANWTIKATPSSGITGTYDSTNHKYKVTGITVDAGYVEFECTRSGYAAITKRFSIIKERSGADGKDVELYSVEPDFAIMKLNASNVFYPTAVTFSASKRVGNDTTSSAYSGRFKIYETTDGTQYTLKYTSSSNESSKTYTPSSTSVVGIKAELYLAGGTTRLLDTQGVAVVADGKTGKDGKAGNDSLNVVIGNIAEVIPCTEKGYASMAKDINIPFSCYIGTTRTSGTIATGTLPTGVTVKSNTAATASAEGLLVLTVASGATLASSTSGDITLTVTSNKLTSTHKFTWTKSIQAKSNVLFQIYAPNGDVILNKSNNVVLNTTFTYGSTPVTSGVAYQWQKLGDTSYENISGATKSSLTVVPNMVDGNAPFRCVATYDGSTYYAYWCVTDRSDEVNIEAYSSVGTQIVNGKGIGAVYALAFRAGEELDPIKSTTFSATAPTGAKSGDFYYKIDAEAKTVTLMKYNGSAWAVATSADQPKYSYQWYRRDKDGNVIDTASPYITGKVLYIDSSIINKKTTFRCKFVMN